MIDSSGTRTPAQPHVADDDALTRLRAGHAIPVGRLTMTAEPDGSSFTLTDAAGGSRTFQSLDELDAAVIAAPTSTPPPVSYVPAPAQDEPTWCTDHEVVNEGHIEDQVTIHRSPGVEVVTDGWEYAVRLTRHDFVLLPEGAAPEDVQVLLDEEGMTPEQAMTLGAALIAAARKAGLTDQDAGLAEHPFDPVPSGAAQRGPRAAPPVLGGRNSRS